jgi:two-component system sensor histidine kinase RegB
MGLGIFIARTLLQRTGASVDFSNLDGGGAQVVVRWRRAALEAVAA